MKRRLHLAVILAAAAFALAAPVFGQGPALAMLDRLEAGRWELRLRDGDRQVESICLRDGRRLIQLRHPSASCERLVVDDGPSEVTVQYTCRGQGYGRTHIRRETSGLVQIDSQGIAQGLPFSFAAEARRVGGCGG